MHKIHKTLYKVGTKIQFNRTKNPDDFHGLRIRDFDILYNNLRVNSKLIQIDKHVKATLYICRCVLCGKFSETSGTLS